ncbi:zf-HC2 domain-containing protein [Gorillibacterium timonense]|uniref:zf-HC2 domain-containing protein n=1 Tax=Gorillibacterium timonense TaxID=1689269 RepID=UPI00071E0B2D|nr:zf-HC2 domain-containing protein [Gorillibacterium timonense]
MHYSRDTWRSYQEDLLPEQERLRMEDHLESCDHCLAIYLEALHPTLVQMADQGESSVDFVKMTSSIMESVQRLQPLEAADAEPELVASRPRTKERWYERKLFHYAVAAAMTMAIISTGVLEEVSRHLNQVESSLSTRQEKTVSGQLMERTADLLNSIQPTENGGTKRVP